MEAASSIRLHIKITNKFDEINVKEFQEFAQKMNCGRKRGKRRNIADKADQKKENESKMIINMAKPLKC